MAFLARSALVASAVIVCGATSTGGSVSTSFLSGAKDAEMKLQTTLQTVLQGGKMAERLDKIEASMWRSFQSLPKDSNGRLSAQAVRYLVHGYFSQHHGWLITGLASNGPTHNMTDLQNAGILQDKAPLLLEALLAAKHRSLGMSLRDAAAMAASLERLIMDESVGLLEVSYNLNELTTDDLVDKTGLREVLMSFMMLFELGDQANHTDVDTHLVMKENLEETIDTDDSFWGKLDEFQQDAVHNYIFERRRVENPFVPQHFEFDTATELVETLAHGYGKWQDLECREMKDELMKLDFDGFGRVPLSRFYSQPETAIYKFGESVDYLRSIGALDESHPREPQVRIANYLAGPSNCVAGSEFYSVCCLSECESLMSEIEGNVAAPAVGVEKLLKVMASISSTTVDARKQLPDALVKRLHSIAEHHDGEVPLHGRLFAQWLHYVFPIECQFPANLVSESVLLPSHWKESGHTSTAEEKERYIAMGEAASDNSYLAVGDEQEDEALLQWSTDEVLPFQQQKSFSTAMLRSVGRNLVQLALLSAVGRMAVVAWKSASRARAGEGADSKSHYV